MDIAALVGLTAMSLAVRRALPSDGLFYDDAWQALAVREGSLGNLALVGQSQPGFVLLLLGWSVAGTDPTTYVGPALIAGVVGPPCLYAFLRRCQISRPVAWLLGAALAASTVHIIATPRVKSYTIDLLLVMLATLVVGRIVRWRWDRRTAVAWAVGAALVATFSATMLLASVAAAAVLVLHPRHDRRVRIVAVAFQLLAHVALLAVTSQQLNARLVSGFFRGRDGYLDVGPNPLATVDDGLNRLARIMVAYPGVDGPGLLLRALGLLALGGLGLAAWRGTETIRARFLGLALLMAVAGSAVRIVPFGPEGLSTQRVTLWLVPALALGLGTAFDRGRIALDQHSGGLRRIADVAVVVAAVVVFAVGDRGPGPNDGSGAATELVMEQRRDGDVVWLTRPTTFSFALASEAPLDLESTPERAIGFLPRFEDPGFVPLPDFDVDPPALDASLDGAERVWLVHAIGRRGAAPERQRRALGQHLEAAGFTRVSQEEIRSTTVELWERTDPAG